MTSILNSKTVMTLSVAFAMIVVTALPVLARAQADDGDCCGSDVYDTYTPDDSSVYDTYTPEESDIYDTYTPEDSDIYDTYTPEDSDIYDTYTPDESDIYDTYTPYSYTDYSTDEYDTNAYSTGYGGSSYSQPFTIGAPSYYSGGSGYSTPISAPVIQNVPVAYQQQQQQQQIAPVTNNTCVNYSCNTVTTISNSGNTTTVIPVTQTPVTYPVQYTFPQNNYQNVSCSISASQSSVQSGQYVYLTWQSYGATSATLTNHGNVAPNGSLSVQPYGSTNYVLTVYGYNGQTATCNTYVTAGYNYPSVTLSQIPYTGFDFGTMGDAMYFAFLALFALAAGYLLVYYKGGMGSFAFAMIPARKTKVTSQVVEKKSAPVVEKRVETPAPKASMESLPVMSFSRPTSDSMSVASEGGAPRIVISRN